MDMEQLINALLRPKTQPLEFTNRKAIKGKTVLVSDESELREALIELANTLPMKGGSYRIVALDIESTDTDEDEDKVAVLTLATTRCCLLIQLLHFKSMPTSLRQFLRHKDIFFYGDNMKFCLDCLSVDYGLRVRNNFDIGELSAQIDKNTICFEGLSNLFYNLACMNKSQPPRIANAAYTDWGAKDLSLEQVVSCTVDALAIVFTAQNLIRLSKDASDCTKVGLDFIKANLDDFTFGSSLEWVVDSEQINNLHYIQKNMPIRSADGSKLQGNASDKFRENRETVREEQGRTGNRAGRRPGGAANGTSGGHPTIFYI